METKLRIHLPIWTPKQAEIDSSPAKRKVLLLGRRFGKTTYLARKGVEYLLQGKRILEAAPTAKQTNAF